MAADYLVRSRHGVYYFRRSVPVALRMMLGRRQLMLSLRTGILREARSLVRAGAASSDRLFDQLLAMSKKKGRKPELFQVDLIVNGGFDSNGNPYFHIDAEPDEIQDAKTLIASTTEALVAVQSAGGPKPVASKAAEAVPTGPTLATATTEFLAQLQAKATTKRRYAPGLARLRTYFGADTPIGSITQARFAQFAAEIRGDETAAIKTRNMIITLGGTLFSWCASRYDGAPSITASKLKIKRTTPEREERAAFSVAELRAILDAVSTMRTTEPHKFWVTALLMFTGMRLEELAQLDINDDLLLDEESGYWYFKVHGNDGNSVKTLAGWRDVPLHPVLIKAGLLKYVEQMRAGGATRLFPQWPPREDPEHGGVKYGHEVSKWGGRQLAKLAYAGAVSTKKAAYFHSMRHSFINHLKQALVDESLRAALVGHETGGINNKRYGKGYSVRLLGDTVVEKLPEYATLISDHRLEGSHR